MNTAPWWEREIASLRAELADVKESERRAVNALVAELEQVKAERLTLLTAAARAHTFFAGNTATERWQNVDDALVRAINQVRAGEIARGR
jgi:hypothetical protein